MKNILLKSGRRIRGTLVLLFLFLTSFAIIQAQVTVTGTVTSAEDDTPIPGVNIIEKGTSNGSITNADGTYNITVTDRRNLGDPTGHVGGSNSFHYKLNVDVQDAIPTSVDLTTPYVSGSATIVEGSLALYRLSTSGSLPYLHVAYSGSVDQLLTVWEQNTSEIVAQQTGEASLAFLRYLHRVQ